MYFLGHLCAFSSGRLRHRGGLFFCVVSAVIDEVSVLLLVCLVHYASRALYISHLVGVVLKETVCWRCVSEPGTCVLAARIYVD